jgi:hypothetical protein
VEAEQFLELVHHEQQLRWNGFQNRPTLADGFNQPVAAAAERGLQVEKRVLGVGVVQSGLAQGAGQVGQGTAAGPHDGDVPGAAGLGHAAPQHGREQTGAHQRGLAAAGGAHDGDQAVAAQAAEEVFDLLVAAEEQVVFLGQKTAQTRKRVAEVGHGIA